MAVNRPTIAATDFDTIKTDMIDYFKSRPEFADYDFTGSSLNMLIDILAYNTHYNALTANFTLSEMYLDTALIRSNVVSHAKLLNYTPRSTRSASATVTLQLTKQTGDGLVVIPAGSVFTSTSGNYTNSFYTIDDHTLRFTDNEADGTTKSINVTVYEGSRTSQRFIHRENTTEFTYIELAQDNIDTSTIRLSVNGTKYELVKSELENIYDITGTSSVFFLEESRNGYPVLVFGNDSLGKALDYGDEVIATYLISTGSAGNNISAFSPSISGRPDAMITTVVSAAQGGDERESIREVKDMAPKWYQAQYRAVTERDYEAIIRNKFADIQSISVYGGETVGQPGKVYIAIKPMSGDKLSDAAKQILKSEIIADSNVVTVDAEIVDPEIVNIVLKTSVIYDNSLLTTSADTIRTKVYTLYNYMNSNYVGSFLSNFLESKLSTEIANLDDSIVSSSTRATLKVSTTVDSNQQKLTKNSFDLKNAFYHPEAGFMASTGGVFSSTQFKRSGSTLLSAFDDDGNGNIRLYDIVDSQKVYFDNKAGTIDYANGTFDITSSLLFDTSISNINFYIVPESYDILTSGNNILTIDATESSVYLAESSDTAGIKAINLGRTF